MEKFEYFESGNSHKWDLDSDRIHVENEENKETKKNIINVNEIVTVKQKGGDLRGIEKLLKKIHEKFFERYFVNRKVK